MKFLQLLEIIGEVKVGKKRPYVSRIENSEGFKLSNFSSLAML
ncbi:hypothetical protein Q4595_10560 [Wenyingzhuangia sp. 1_MG-2023]|nr:hypothetical protein [Wenyingzhuangia sp. 1_MG-2023]